MVVNMKWPDYFIINPKVDEIAEETIPVPRSQLMQLLELAEDDLLTQHSEFSNDPTDEDRILMLSLYRLVGKEVPEFFSRTYGWENSND